MKHFIRQLLSRFLKTRSQRVQLRNLQNAYDNLSVEVTQNRRYRSTPTQLVLNSVAVERIMQDGKWGEQNHPSFRRKSKTHYQLLEKFYKRKNKEAVKVGNLTWDLILLEEVYEALAQRNRAKLREELVQVAAVVTCWIECLDRKTDE